VAGFQKLTVRAPLTSASARLAAVTIVVPSTRSSAVMFRGPVQGPAGPDAAAVGDEVGEDLAHGWVAREGDVVGVAAGREPDGVGGQEHDGGRE
jgi:hypothetical protein